MIEPIHDPRGFDYFARKAFADGREALVYPLTYGRAKLGIGPAGKVWLDEEW